VRTLADMVRRNARLHGDRVAVIDGSRMITHQELGWRASRIAAALRDRFVLKSQDRILILSKNRLEFMEALAASALSGFILVPLNWRLAPADRTWWLTRYPFGTPKITLSTRSLMMTP
jgi:acyl-CoA synthetase (AMP-forming)/AMP-acid ligase II